MGRRTSYDREQAKRKAQLAAKKSAVSTAREAVDALLTKALRDPLYTPEECKEISRARCALDTIVGGWCNLRRRR